MGLQDQAKAKVNLSLKVLGRRQDGYHDLLGLMARIDLGDQIELKVAPDSDILVHQGLSEIDDGYMGSSNLAIRALNLYRELTGWPDFPVKINLTKNIPLGSGMGGGSSDAATVLRLLNRSAKLSPADLWALSVRLGGDVPFFLQEASLRLASGIGEILRPWPYELPGRYLLLVNPGFKLSTGQVFEKLGLTTGESSSKSLNAIARIEARLGDIQKPELGDNDLYWPALAIKPELKDIFRLIKEVTPSPLAAGLSGSGPTFWALFSHLSQAQMAKVCFESLVSKLPKRDLKWWLRVTTIA
ncbi:MAG: 4-(cytidine 5'-diphospho)-2-C-methyl-D-erythritol kinase [Deltaproteobacteria bacterium]|nr:4-(cytidine 5'-diphospho)-2-C-methyl-D-erythritol kinase [Deltaproteobacteria bacterium]